MSQFFWPPDIELGTVIANQGAPGNPATPWFVQPTDGVNLQTFNADGSTNTVVKNKLFSLPYDQITTVSKDINQNPTVIETRLLGVLVQTATFTYDLEGDFQDVVVT